MGAPVVHFEIHARDAAAMQAFYGAAFGWSVTPGAHGYGIVSTGDPRGVQGGIAQAGPRSPAPVLLYLEVDDLDAAAARVIAAGGRLLMKPTVLPAMAMALVADPEGNALGLVRAK
jgi:hypothetical protein